ncbi:MAG: hypothetical protein R3Y54_12750, partial [Eubacteriales bacterium]
MSKKTIFSITFFINLIIFILFNSIFEIRYEQVDDFILLSLYSGIDGIYNTNTIFFHPFLSFILSIFFKIIPAINWHSIYLLATQFICFTAIGFTIIKNNQSKNTVLVYSTFASIFYSLLLFNLQYTSCSILALSTFLLLV